MKMLKITLEGKTYEVGVEVVNSRTPAAATTVAASVQAVPAPAYVAPAPVAPPPVAGGQSITSPMPGLVFNIVVSVGQQVAKDQELVVLEAMKMESPIHAPSAGTVASILVKEGDAVSEGQVLIQLS